MTVQTHIYTVTDVAELFAEHEREHPDHGFNCPCGNGLIAAFWAYFGPVDQVVKPITPYVPPEAVPAKDRGIAQRKPWLNQRLGETKAEYDHRKAHSCYNCGLFIADFPALERHEDDCSRQGRHCGKAGCRCA